MAPMQIWPSAPMFQNFILNASVTPRATMASGTAFRTTLARAVFLASAPFSMV